MASGDSPQGQFTERGHFWAFQNARYRFWHLADIDAGAEHVRSGGLKRTSLIHSPMSANDPQRTSGCRDGGLLRGSTCVPGKNNLIARIRMRGHGGRTKQQASLNLGGRAKA